MYKTLTEQVFRLTEKGDLDTLRKLVKREKIDLSKCWIKQIPISKNWSSSLHGQKDNEFNLLHMAAATSSFNGCGVELLKYFIEEQHLDPSMTTREGDGEALPFCYAVQYGSVDAVRYFIDELHTDPFLLLDDDDTTLLHLAAQGGKVATVKYFVEEKKIDPEVKDIYDRTPLYMCLYDIESTGDEGGLDVIKYFVETCKIDLMNPVRGTTMVHLAAPSFDRSPEVLKYMIETMKCDPQAKNRDGKTPAEYAVRVSRNDKHPVIEYLAKFTAKSE